MRDLAFRWVTLHPTYAVTDGPEPRIDILAAPQASEVLAEARTLGLRVRLEPHLDWAQTLRGGPYEWRRRMYVNPTGAYFDAVLRPMAELLPDELTLGSELDVSAYEFAEDWLSCAQQLQPLGIALGHKLNHDWRSARNPIRGEANVERQRRGLPGQWAWGYGDALETYLAELDYTAISYYPSGALDLASEYTIGEFGLGSTDTSRPWHFDETTFRSPADFALRREYYLRFLQWLRQREGRAASFWTAGHFDILGIMNPEWRDDAVVEAVRIYNQASP